MKTLDVECTENPVNIKKFDILNDDQFPFAFLGVEIKNEYDEKRFLFNRKKYDIKNIVHLVDETQPVAKFFRGIPLQINLNMANLLLRVNDLRKIYTNNITPTMYKNTLERQQLSCDNCLSYLGENIYPIDGECADRLTDDHINVSELYESMLDNKKIPYYQSIGYLSIFILNKSKQNINKDKIKSMLYNK